ncbi:hypothetical protein I302_105642 [Kwoniella bestiolae CBS 10118]|uniref:Uncharacterized protein n=1 Tax=Kwoniella bestiolae CBS 10118 TaxID=1296100 RepID=A0A1B9G1Q9_9TREE|nr:hypothetical protein I302_04760 [Kwoniella bestiolae CBS 10118]OCF24950.1 hypothetical protein I302_04760 [Kwoniella bestiolae CBS 10118]
MNNSGSNPTELYSTHDLSGTTTIEQVLQAAESYWDKVDRLKKAYRSTVFLDWPDQDEFDREGIAIQQQIEKIQGDPQLSDQEKQETGELSQRCYQSLSKYYTLKNDHSKVSQLYQLLRDSNKLGDETLSARLKVQYPNSYPAPSVGDPSFEEQYKTTLASLWVAIYSVSGVKRH